MRALATLMLLAACTDETVTGFAQEKVFQLETLDREAFAATATIDISTPGHVTGAAPCNRYHAAQNAPYPWFELGPIASTKRACADLAEEARFLKALSRMSIAEVAGPVLILSNDAGEEMVFHVP